MKLPNPFRKREYQILTPATKVDDSILERPEFLPEEEVRRSGKKTAANQKKGKQLEGLISYLRKPRAEEGYTVLIAACIAILFTVFAFFGMIQAAGEPSLTVSAAVMSAMLVSAYGIYLAVRALRDKDKDQLYTWVGLSLSSVVTVIWVIALLLGLTS